MSELSRETRELLARGRHGTPLSPARRSRIKAAVFARVAVFSLLGTTATGTLAAVAIRSAGALAVVGVAGVVGVSVAPGLVHRHAIPTMSAPAPKQDDATPRQSQAQAAASLANPPQLVPPTGQPSMPLLSPAGATTSSWPRPSQPSPITVTPAHPSGAPDSPQGTRVRPLEDPAAPISAAEPRSSADAGAPGISSAKTASDGAFSAPLPTPTPASVATASTSRLEEEAALLRAADKAIRSGDGPFALLVLDEADSRFRDGSLLPERLAERVFALCLVGRTREARAAANIFLGAVATGPLAARVRGSCGGSKP
jgi:hypothetical protein